MTVKFTEDHEWLRIEGDLVVVGITEHASEQLGDVVFVELPEVETQVAKGDEACVIESVKAASDIYAPVAGEVIANNQDAIDAPESINADSYANWLFKLAPANAADVAALMDAAAYEAEIAQA